MAENVLGILFEIAADPKKAEAAMARLKASTVAESAGISGAWSSAMNAITGPGAIALGSITALGGGMFELARKAADAGAQIHEASLKTGITAASMSGLRALTKETGGSFETLTMALARAGRNLQVAINEPGLKTSEIFAKVMGGAQKLEALGLKPMDERLQLVLNRIFALNDVGERNVALQALLGRGWMGNVETLKLLAEHGYAPAIEKAKQFGLFYDAEHARQAKEFQIALNNLTAQLQSLALTLGQHLVPMIREVMRAFVGLLPRLQDWYLKIKAVALALAGDLVGAANAWEKSHKKFQQTVQEQTDFLVHLQNMTREAAKETEKHAQALDKATVALDHHTKANLRALQHLKPIIPEVSTLNQLFSQQVPILHELDTSWRRHLETLNQANETYLQLALEAPKAYEQAAAAGESSAKRQQIAHGDLVKSSLGATLSLIGHRKAAAVIEAIWEAAEGFKALAHFNFWSAAQHFASAAQFGIIAGQSGGGSTGGGGVAGASGRAAAETAALRGPARERAGGEGQRQPHMVINIVGGINSGSCPSCVKRVIREINEEVLHGGSSLVATTAIAPIQNFS